MEHRILKKLNVLSLLGLAIMFFACSGEKNEPEPPAEKLKKTVLLYAVASNNLDIYSDKSEILKAADNIDLDSVSMLVYEVTNSRTVPPTLSQVEKDKSGKAIFNVVKEYDRSLYSTDPKRVAQVMNDVRDLRPADSYGLVFWGHGSGLDPENSGHPVRSEDDFSSVLVPIQKAFGYDIDKDKDSQHRDWIDIDELAAALPDDMFEFIWFDVCYMSNIETVYQFRNKCRFYVGYPTEVGDLGMPYDKTLLYLLGDLNDLIDGAKVFFEHYDGGHDLHWDRATIAVLDMSKLDMLADACRSIFENSSDVASDGILKYTRDKSSIGPFYDFGQFVAKKAATNPDNPDVDYFNRALSEFVVWKGATKYDFNDRLIAGDSYSGLSCYLFRLNDSDKKAKFYKTLDWYKRVY